MPSESEAGVATTAALSAPHVYDTEQGAVPWQCPMAVSAAGITVNRTNSVLEASCPGVGLGRWDVCFGSPADSCVLPRRPCGAWPSD